MPSPQNTTDYERLTPNLSNLPVELQRIIWHYAFSDSGPVIAYFEMDGPRRIEPIPVNSSLAVLSDLLSNRRSSFEISSISTRPLLSSQSASMAASCPQARLHCQEVYPLAHTSFVATSSPRELPKPHLNPFASKHLGPPTAWLPAFIPRCDFANTIFYLGGSWLITSTIDSLVACSFSHSVRNVALGLPSFPDYDKVLLRLADAKAWPVLESITLVAPGKVEDLDGLLKRTTPGLRSVALCEWYATWKVMKAVEEKGLRMVWDKEGKKLEDGGDWSWEVEKARLESKTKKMVKSAWKKQKRTTGVPDVRVKVSDFAWMDYGDRDEMQNSE